MCPVAVKEMAEKAVSGQLLVPPWSPQSSVPFESKIENETTHLPRPPVRGPESTHWPHIVEYQRENDEPKGSVKFGTVDTSDCGRNKHSGQTGLHRFTSKFTGWGWVRWTLLISSQDMCTSSIFPLLGPVSYFSESLCSKVKRFISFPITKTRPLCPKNVISKCWPCPGSNLVGIKLFLPEGGGKLSFSTGCFFVFDTDFCCIAQAHLKLAILLPQTSECWHCRCMPSYSASFSFFFFIAF